MRQMIVIRPFYNFRKGDVITPTGVWRDHLKGRGYIAEIDVVAPVEAKPQPEPAAKRKPGRPRKSRVLQTD